MICKIKKEGIKSVIDIDGKTLYPSAYMSYCIQKENIDLAKAHGIRLFMLPIYAGDEGINMESGLRPFYDNYFKGYAKYDFSTVDNLMELVCPDPKEDIYIIPRVCLEPPIWWQKQNPDAIAKDHRGEPQRECFTSDKWREDMMTALKALIDHIHSSKWKDKVIGYHIAAGGTEEWAYHSRFNKQYYDYSDRNLQAYKAFLKEKYPDIAALSQSWGYPVVSFDEIRFPHPIQRTYAKEGFLRNPAVEQDVLDFFDFHNRAVAETIIYFCKGVKEYTNYSRLTGAFYGYVVAMPQSKKGLHGLGTLLKSEHIDFLSTTNTNMGPGGAWDFSSAVHSAMLHGKLWICEGDIRTCKLKPLAESMPHAVPDNDYYSANVWKGPETMFKTLSHLKKALARTLTTPCGIWWFDMFGGWYDEEMMAVIKKMAPLYKKQQSMLFKSEIALIIDENGHKFIANEESAQARAMCELQRSLSRCGAPYDVYLQSDLSDPRFPTEQYKLIIFATSPCPSEEEQAAIKKLQSKDRVLMWLYASGYYEPELTKFKLKATDMPCFETAQFEKQVYPVEKLPIFEFDTESGYVISRLEDSQKPAVIWKNMGSWHSVFSLHLSPASNLIRHIALLAGVHLYNLTNDVIFAGGEFVAIHSTESGYRRISLPYPDCLAENAVTGDPVPVNDRFIDLNFDAGDTVLIHVTKT